MTAIFCKVLVTNDDSRQPRSDSVSYPLAFKTQTSRETVAILSATTPFYMVALKNMGEGSLSIAQAKQLSRRA